MTTVAIKERPILFSGPMVRAILDGRKTQTRRIVKDGAIPFEGDKCQPSKLPGCWDFWSTEHPKASLRNLPLDYAYGLTGDHLWVRETWEPLEFNDHEVGVVYAATPTEGTRQKNAVRWVHVGEDEALKWQHRSGKKFPGIHMPRWASRLTLEITGIRVERLQAISAADILNEGAVERAHYDKILGKSPISAFDGCCYPDLISLWAAGWEKINGKGSWKENPWVWALTFRRVS